MFHFLEILPLLLWISRTWGHGREFRELITISPELLYICIKKTHVSKSRLFQSSKVGTSISPIVQLKEPRHRSGPSSQGYTGSGGQSWAVSADLAQSEVPSTGPDLAAQSSFPGKKKKRRTREF